MRVHVWAEGEFVQEHEQIRQVQFIENMRVYMQRIQPEGADMKRGNTQPGGAGQTLNLFFSALFSFKFL